ncbi:MAG: hypothetical protein IV103_14195 [Zoogloea sp.]|nr:hypothetical protein [Zoogloea sp.]
MEPSADDVRTVLTVIAVGISIASLYFSRRSWLQSNRPIVTAFITEHASGNTGAVFNLVVSNTGNRPATNVRIHAASAMISRLLIEGTEQKLRESIEMCFSEEATIPVLRNGEELETGFGAFTSPKTGNGTSPWLAYGEEIPVEIRYCDLEGRAYISKHPLKVYARKGFGGSVWQ